MFVEKLNDKKINIAIRSYTHKAVKNLKNVFIKLYYFNCWLIKVFSNFKPLWCVKQIRTAAVVKENFTTAAPPSLRKQ